MQIPLHFNVRLLIVIVVLVGWISVVRRSWRLDPESEDLSRKRGEEVKSRTASDAVESAGLRVNGSTTSSTTAKVTASPKSAPSSSYVVLPKENLTYVPLPRGSRPERLLIILSVGDRFYYEDLVVKERDKNSSTLAIVYFGSNNETAKRHEGNADIFFRARGYKYHQARELLLANMARWRLAYDFVFIPDDDLSWTRGATLAQFVQIARDHRLQICQPARDPEVGAPSYPILLARAQCKLRFVNFIENQAPMFSMDYVESILLPVLARCRFIELGWYLDYAWTLMIGERWKTEMAVVDATPIGRRFSTFLSPQVLLCRREKNVTTDSRAST